jgi:signal transduction histidine kinase
MVGVQMDVSERREMEARLGIAERLAAVGTLAAGVAHEINNPLMYVTGNVEVANRVLRRLREAESLAPLVTGPLRSSWDELGSALQAAQEGAERVRVIVRDLKVLSRAQETPAKPMNVRAVVEASLTVASNAIANRAKLIKEIEDVPAVMGQESRLGQVVLNLLMNAVHAIPEGNPAGHIIRVVTSTDAQGRVVIEVGDSGEGIPPDVLGRIFDPFFTTKDVGAGTGLGLSISLSLVKSMGGAIDVQSEPGVGSTFRVILPAASK